MTDDRPPVRWPSVEKRRRGFERVYSTQPERFAGPPSRFSEWAAEVLEAQGVREGGCVDLGCGLGRDARRFARMGFDVLGVDYSTTAIERARADPDNPPGLRYEADDARSALRRLPAGSQAVVYVHAVYMMLPDDELEETVHEVARVLRPGGLHLFAVRATTDPFAGTGIEVAPDVWQRPHRLGGAESGAPYRYFRAETVDRLTRLSGLVRLSAEHRSDVHFWYVGDRRP